jgi:hypothetical protein
MTSPVIPAKAGIQEKQAVLDPGFRRGDGFDDFLRSRELQICGENLYKLQNSYINTLILHICSFMSSKN